MLYLIGRITTKTMVHRRGLQINVDSNYRGRGELKLFAFPKLYLLMILACEQKNTHRSLRWNSIVFFWDHELVVDNEY
jgi:hypothetical protein